MLKDDETSLTERTELIKTGVLEKLVLGPVPDFSHATFQNPKEILGNFCDISKVLYFTSRNFCYRKR